MNAQKYISLILFLLLLVPASGQQATPSPQRPAAATPAPAQVAQARKPALGQRSHTPRPGGVAAQVTGPLLGQSMTLLPDGGTLTLGGAAASGPVTRALLNGRVAVPLGHARAYHSATVLSDGRVLVFGGLDDKGLVTSAELYKVGRFQPFQSNLAPRAHHSATLLTDGRVLIAGGISADGKPLDRLELWDPWTKTSQILPPHLSQARRSHKATLQSDGSVRIEYGVLADGLAASKVEVYSPDTGALTILDSPEESSSELKLAASIPGNDAQGGKLDSLIALRLSRALGVKTLTSATIAMRDQRGPVAIQVEGAEVGMLAFVAPSDGLQPDSV